VKSIHKRIALWALIGLVVIAGLASAFWPRSLPVDIEPVVTGPMLQTIDGEGETQVVDKFVVSAPTAGRLRRIESEPGDVVIAGETVVAELEPSDAQLLDARTEAEVQAQLNAAMSAATLAEAEQAKAEAELKFARSELNRSRELAVKGTIAERELEAAERAFETNKASLSVAQANMQVRRYELQQIQSRLMTPAEMTAHRELCQCLLLNSPIDGRILRVLRESEGFVQAGQGLIEIGDPSHLEILVDLLSKDAVQVSVGDTAIIENWGGSQPLTAQVRRIEPFGFTKTSALGIDEQRVNVVLDFVSPRSAWQGLGHGYQVDVNIVIWERDDVIKIPLTALFRDGEAWAVFVAEGGRARKRNVEVGVRNDSAAQILAGLEPADQIVVYPGVGLQEGVRIVAR
jgi:HlyD family secretion protein